MEHPQTVQEAQSMRLPSLTAHTAFSVGTQVWGARMLEQALGGQGKAQRPLKGVHA